MLDSDDEQFSGPSLKRTRAASPRQGKSMDIKDEWKQDIVYTQEISNAECHVMQTQLEGVFQAWEAENVELFSLRVSLRGICRGVTIQILQIKTFHMSKSILGRT